MKKYYVTAEILHATGYQTYSVLANSEEEAIKELNDGGGEWVEEDVEITDLGEWVVCEIEEIEE